MSQRLLFALLTLGGLILGAVFGTPGKFPSFDDRTITPDFIISLLTPIGLLVTVAVQFFRALNARIASGEVNPNDLKKLFTMHEFWVAAVANVAGIIQLFWKVEFLTPDRQALIADLLMALAGMLLRDYAVRPSGALPTEVSVKVEKESGKTTVETTVEAQTPAPKSRTYKGG